MKTKYLYTAGLIAILIGCLGILGSSVMAGSKNMAQLTKIKLSDLTPSHFESQVSWVDPTDRCIVVGGFRIAVVEGQRMGSGEVITTKIYDENGRRIPLSQLKNYDRIQIDCYKTVADGFLFAERIQRLAPKPGDKRGPSSEPQ